MQQSVELENIISDISITILLAMMQMIYGDCLGEIKKLQKKCMMLSKTFLSLLNHSAGFGNHAANLSRSSFSGCYYMTD